MDRQPHALVFAQHAPLLDFEPLPAAIPFVRFEKRDFGGVE
jgi:hypothetical protein